MIKNNSKSKYFVPGQIKNIVVVGVGGTGAYLAEGLAKLTAGYNLDLDVLLVDPDVVEDKNILRQNFHTYEIGAPKAHALAIRINQQFGLSFASRQCLGEEIRLGPNTLLVTCVDNVEVRKKFAAHNMWLDTGNGLDFGQVCFGTTKDRDELKTAAQKWGEQPFINSLPNPYLVLGLEGAKQASEPSCADHPFAEQGCFINNWSAMTALSLLHQILVFGRVTTPAVWFNTGKNRITPATITQGYLVQH